MDRVSPGDKLTIRAPEWNQIADVVNNRVVSIKNTGTKSVGLPPNADVIRVINDDTPTGEFQAVRITGPLNTPSSTDTDAVTEAFKYSPIFKIKKLDTTASTLGAGKWVLSLQYLSPGDIGFAVVAGLTVARINVTDAKHAFVEADYYGNNGLKSAVFGSSDIVWIAGGVGTATATGDQWAMIRMNTHDAGVPRIGYVKNAQGSPYPPSWSYDLYSDLALTKLIKTGVSVSGCASTRSLGAYATSAADGSQVGYMFSVYYSDIVPTITEIPEHNVLDICIN